MSETPRTDARAAEMERALTRIAELDLAGTDDRLVRYIILPIQQAAREALTLAPEPRHPAIEKLLAQLAAERALADRLLAITEKVVSDHEGTLHCDCDCKCSGRRIANDNAEALAAWKGARSETC